jgi:16S rRNA (guanine527-N7)-methyltransferase
MASSEAGQLPADADQQAIVGHGLGDVLNRYKIDLPPDQIDRLERYAQALWEINQSLNLTRHTTYEKFATRDIVDSLQLADLLADGERVLDLGTGGGVPGVILSIVRPQLRIELCDSVAKKAKAARDIVDRLGLAVPVHHCRGEQLLATRSFDAVVVRAVAPLAKVLKWLERHWSNAGRLLVIKGSRWAQERGEARHRGLLQKLELRRAAMYVTPGTGAQNVILKIWRKTGG